MTEYNHWVSLMLYKKRIIAFPTCFLVELLPYALAIPEPS